MSVSYRPKISVLLCTARGEHCYLDHPEWSTVGKIVDDLERQTFKDFELIVVDGMAEHRDLPCDVSFPIIIDPPRASLFVRHKKAAISAYRNTGLSLARGELVVNLDDCCVLPPNYLEVFWGAWSKYWVCASAMWPKRGDWRKPGRVDRPGVVYGFGSYPLSAAIELNGYDEAYDGSQGLEDCDWSTRLFNAGVPMALFDIPGFDIEPQTGHDARAIDLERPLVRCCNASWQTQREIRQVRRANERELWTQDMIRRLVGPCVYLMDDHKCAHHHGQRDCAYIKHGFAESLDPLAAELYDGPPVFDLLKARKENGL